MEVRNCRNCGRLFNYLGGMSICPACREIVEQQFESVKEYIRENPHANIQEIAGDNGVSTNQIRQWIREERLQFSADSPIGIECEACGATIKTGRYCDACKINLSNTLSKSIAKPKPKEEEKPKSKADHKNKMRFLEQ